MLSALGKDLPNTTLILALTALLVEEAQAAAKSDAASAADAAKNANKSLDKSDKKSDEKQAGENDKTAGNKDDANAEKTATDKAEKPTPEAPDAKATDAAKAPDGAPSKLVVSAQELLRAVLEDEANYQTALAQNRVKDPLNSAPDAVLAARSILQDEISLQTATAQLTQQPEKFSLPTLPTPTLPGFDFSGGAALAGLGAGFLLGALGGGGAGSVVVKAVLASYGIVADGYIQGAKVYREDAAGNPLDGKFAITDQFGKFDLSLLPAGNGRIVASGGIDTSTGLEFKVKLYAPAGSTVINPLTTLVQGYMEANPGTTAAAASKAVATALAIGANVDLLNYDPIAAASASTGTGQAEALSIQIKAAQVANLLVTGAVAVSQAGGTSYEAAASDVLKRLVTEITNAASSPTAVQVTLNSPAVLTRVLSNVTTDLVELIVKGNTISATTLHNLSDFQNVVQDDLAQAAGLSTLTPQALQALDSLLGVISSGQKVVEMGLAPGADTGADTTDLLTRLANPSIRVDLSSDKSVIAVGHVVELRIEGLALASAPVTAADLSRGYLDFSVQNFATDGSKTLSVVVTDPVSQKALATGFLAITIDTHVAALTAALQSDTGLVGDNITQNSGIQIAGLENGAYWQFSTDGGSTWSSNLLALSTQLSVNPGAVQVQLRQVDKAGNISDVSAISFTLDKTAAAPVLQLANDTGIVGDNITSDPAVKLSGVEQGASVQYSIDGGTTWLNQLPKLSNGAVSLLVKQTDLAGNVSLPGSLSFKLENVSNAPQVSLRSDTGAVGDLISKDGSLLISGLADGATLQYNTVDPTQGS